MNSILLRCLAIALAFVTTSLAFVLTLVRPRALRGEGVPSPDLYGYSAPMMTLARRAWEAGHGLLWNDLQNAGQPFLAIPSSGVLYPPTLLVGGLELFDALQLWIVLHLSLAGGASFLLGRTIGQSRAAAVASALAVQFGGVLPFFALWSPIVLATYAWLPVVLLACERLLRQPGAARAIALGVALTFQLLGGFPQIVVFTYELIGLRVLWQLATAPSWRGLRPLGWVAGALALPLLLGAVQVFPSIELLSESVRAAPMHPADINLDARGGDPLGRLRVKVERRWPQGGFLAIVLLLAGAAAGKRDARRIAGCYGLLGAIFLALVVDSPLRDAYQSLPVVGHLRGPERFAWMASLCACLLVGSGVDALRSGRAVRSDRAWTLAGAAAGALAFQLLAPSGWSAREVGLGAAVLAAPLLVWLRPALQPIALTLIGGALAVQLGLAVARGPLRLLADPQETHAARALFEAISKRRSLQERVLVLPRDRWLGASIGLLDKSPSLFGLPSISDYEHLTSRRYATVYVYMTTGRFLETAGQWIGGFDERPRNRPLLNLLATRYVISDRKSPALPGPMNRRWRSDGMQVLENRAALPRAYFARSAEVVADPRETLARLASVDHDPRTTVLLANAPADGYLGDRAPAGAAPARVTIRSARSESIELEVRCERGGFIVLTDQYFPGWSATVDARPSEILQANHAFRAVRVPAGASRVRFRYRPASLIAGAILSAGTALALAACGAARWRSRGRRRS